MKSPARSVRINGSLLRKLRLDRGWTQEDLARAAGYSMRLIRKAESSARIDIETLRNISQAIGGEADATSLQKLTLDNIAMAQAFMDALNDHGPKMVDQVAEFLSEDFVFFCPGEPGTAPFIGTWYGAEGLHKFFEIYFGIFRRVPHTDVVYSSSDELVIARYMESAYVGEQLFGPIRVNMVFQFRDGMIHRIDDDYDTQAGVVARSASEDIASKKLEMVRTFVECYDAGGADMIERCGQFFTSDFEFHCPADPTAVPFAGVWKGIPGMMKFLEIFYGIFTRQLNSLNVEYMVSDHRIVAHFIDRVYHQGHELPPHWVNLHFQFREGLICRIEDQFDHFSAKRAFDELLAKLSSTDDSQST